MATLVAAKPTLQQQDFEYQTGYSGIILTMKDDLITQLKNNMIHIVLDQEFMQNVLFNYWSLKPTEPEK